jgi:hypothetical protein
MSARDFHIGDVLSVTTGCLVSPEGIGGVYKILNWMTGDDLMTHQLPRACEECQGPMLAQHPDLADVQIPTFSDKAQAKAALDLWLADVAAKYGQTRPVAPLAAEDHTVIDPLEEMALLFPHVQVIPVVLPSRNDDYPQHQGGPAGG